MDGIVSISIGDLMKLVMFLIAVCVGIYLIILIKNISDLVNSVDSIIRTNEPNVNQLMDVVPDIAKNVNEVVISSKDSVDKLNNAVTVAENVVCDTVQTVAHGTESLVDYMSLAKDIVKIIVNMFSRKAQ